ISLKKAYASLAPWVILRVCVPNDVSVGKLAYQEHFKYTYRWIALPDHINYFTYSQMHYLLANCDFTDSYRPSNLQLQFLLLSGMNYYQNHEERNKVGPFIRNFQNAWISTGRDKQLRGLYESLAQLDMGRSIFMYGMKDR